MLDDVIIAKLADEDDLPDFVCPDCGGAFFSQHEGIYECDTVTDSFRCKWKGPASACLVPARAALAKEIALLREFIERVASHTACSRIACVQAEHYVALSDEAKRIILERRP